jgi:DNA-binding Lrp family transcriptional regulator
MAYADLSTRSRAIYDYLERTGPQTDREVMHGMLYSEPNMVRPRITEMVKAGLLEECGSKVDRFTGKPCRLVRVPKQESAEQLKMF